MKTLFDSRKKVKQNPRFGRVDGPTEADRRWWAEETAAIAEARGDFHAIDDPGPPTGVFRTPLLCRCGRPARCFRRDGSGQCARCFQLTQAQAQRERDEFDFWNRGRGSR